MEKSFCSIPKRDDQVLKLNHDHLIKKNSLRLDGKQIIKLITPNLVLNDASGSLVIITAFSGLVMIFVKL